MLAKYISAKPQISKLWWTSLFVITFYLFQLNFFYYFFYYFLLFLSCHYAVLLLWLGLSTKTTSWFGFMASS